MPGTDTIVVSEPEQAGEEVKTEDPFITAVIKIVEENICEADFSVKNMTQNSPFLHKLDTEKTFYEGMVTQLRSNKVLQRVLENPESKKAFISALEALSNELKTE